MCAPAAIGVAQAGVGIAGAFGQHSAQQQQHAAAKQAAEIQRQQMIENANYSDAMDEHKWLNTQELWAAKKSQYNEGLANNRDAAAKAYGVASMQEEKLFRDFVANSANIQLQQMSAKSGGLGQRGNTANRLNALPAARAGEALATARDNLLYGQENIRYQTNDVRDQWEDTNRKMWREVSIAPQPSMRGRGRTMLPADPPAPSSAGLVTGIGSSLLSGVSAFNQLSPPGQGLFGGGGGNLQGLQIGAPSPMGSMQMPSWYKGNLG